jgi:mannitol-1-phosphate/altronate dehydrogenase
MWWVTWRASGDMAGMVVHTGAGNWWRGGHVMHDVAASGGVAGMCWMTWRANDVMSGM